MKIAPQWVGRRTLSQAQGVYFNDRLGRFAPFSDSLYGWFDADTVSGADGDLVATWPDLSGSGNDFTASGTDRPTLKTKIKNGRSVVRFNGSNNRMSIANDASLENANITVFVVVDVFTYTSDAIIQHAHDTTDTNPFSRWLIFHSAGASEIVIRWNGNSTATGDWSTATGWRVYCLQDATLRQGDRTIVSAADDDLTYPNASDIFISGNPDSAGTVDGDYAEIMLYNRSLSATERDKVYAYIGRKWGVAG